MSEGETHNPSLGGVESVELQARATAVEKGTPSSLLVFMPSLGQPSIRG